VLGSSLFFEERTGRHIRVEEMDPRPTVLLNLKEPIPTLDQCGSKTHRTGLDLQRYKNSKCQRTSCKPPVLCRFFDEKQAVLLNFFEN